MTPAQANDTMIHRNGIPVGLEELIADTATGWSAHSYTAQVDGQEIDLRLIRTRHAGLWRFYLKRGGFVQLAVFAEWCRRHADWIAGRTLNVNDVDRCLRGQSQPVNTMEMMMASRSFRRRHDMDAECRWLLDRIEHHASE